MISVTTSVSDVDKATRAVCCRLKTLWSTSFERVLVERGSNIFVQTKFQSVFNIRFGSSNEQAIHEIIMTHALAAERLGPGGFDACIKKLLEKFEFYDPNNLNKNDTRIFEAIVGSGTTVPTLSDVGWVLTEHMAGVNVMTRMMLSRAIDLAGFGGRIVVEKAVSSPSVELIRGYSFDQSPVWPINIKLDKPRVVCVDGFIESVSEIHHLLEEASSSREHVLLFVRGMSPDVTHTLTVNYDRGSLRVVPIIVRFDVEGINTMNDVCVASGADIVSSHKGDLVSNIKLNTAPRIDAATVSVNKVTLVNTTSKRSVESHVTFLRKKRLEEKVDDVARLFDARIRSLSPNHVVVRLPNDKDYVSSAQAIDYALRAIRALVDHGTVIVGGKRMLAVTAMAAAVHSTRCFEALTSIGAVIR